MGTLIFFMEDLKQGELGADVCIRSHSGSRGKEKGLGWNQLVGYCNSPGERENESEPTRWFWRERGLVRGVAEWF